MIESKEKIFAECFWTDSDEVKHQTELVPCESKKYAVSVAQRFCKRHLKNHPNHSVRYEVYSLRTVRKILSSHQFRKTS
jgi:hypothetical protein